MPTIRLVTSGQSLWIVLFLLIIAIAPDLGAREADVFLQSNAVVIDKASPVVAQNTLDYLRGRDSVTASVWVFFRDKGIRTAAAFDSASAALFITERAENRRRHRATGGRLFADLPIFQRYVDKIVNLGATHRRSSRWLNAASFDLPMNLLETVASLPEVAEIKPIAGFRLPEEIESNLRLTPPDQAQSAEALNYGPSQTQDYQIGVPIAHNRGLIGKGVTLTMTDTGFRKTHSAFTNAISEGRVLAEYDFVMNDGNTSQQPGDPSNQWSHGTLTWSVAGGYSSGQVIGPAYGANFILCKTENVASETPIEEDNWVAALEFADSVGTDVISTSLGYSDWYTYADMNGQTAVITIAANTCDALGIVLAVSAGNNGSQPGTISAPADAFNVLAVGAVDATGRIAAFSSRGPTYDGRIKPEICAMGVDTYGASSTNDNMYTYASGTSLSAPLIAGAACLMIEARPDLTPAQVRQALQATASQSASPDNAYGWGVADLGKALNWPVSFVSDTTQGPVPLEVNLTNQSWLSAVSQTWDFGDGTTSDAVAGHHVYSSPGLYNVSLTISTDEGPFTGTISGMIRTHSDTLSVGEVASDPGSKVRVDVYARNFLPIEMIEIPFSWDGTLDITYDSFSTAGLRTSYFSSQSLISLVLSQKRATLLLRTSGSVSQPSLEPGSGPVISLYFTVPYGPTTGSNPISLESYGSYSPQFKSGGYSYNPSAFPGLIRMGCCLGQVGDVNGVDGDEPTLADITMLIDHLFISGIALPCVTEADANQSGGLTPVLNDISLGDVFVLIDYLFISGGTVPLPRCL